MLNKGEDLTARYCRRVTSIGWRRYGWRWIELLSVHSIIRTLRNSEWLVSLFVEFASYKKRDTFFSAQLFSLTIILSSSNLPSFSCIFTLALYNSTSSLFKWHFLVSLYHHSLSFLHLALILSMDIQQPSGWIPLHSLLRSRPLQIT